MTRFTRPASSLTARIAAGYLLVVGLLVTGWLWSLYGPLSDAMIRQQEQTLTVVARSTALALSDAGVDPDLIARKAVAGTDLRLTVIALDGTVLADSRFPVADMENHASRPEVIAALDGATGTARRTSKTADADEIYVAVPAERSGVRIAVRTSQTIADIKQTTGAARRLGLALLVITLLASLMIGSAAARRAATPVHALAHAAQRMASGDLSTTIPRVPGDLTSLAISLTTLRDQMSTRIQALTVERETLRATLDGLADAVLVVEAGTITLANAATATVLRREGRHFEGQPLDEAVLPGSVLRALSAYLDGSGPSVSETQPDPTGWVLRIMIAPLRTEGGPTRIIVTVSDVTERVRVEHMRRDFVANASHELKTPVAGLSLLAQSAEMALQDGDTQKANEFTSSMEAQIDLLRSLVSDLLDLSRLETTRPQDSITEVRPAVDRSMLSHRATASRTGVRLSAEYDPAADSDPFVAIETTDLAIALDNLLDNALRHTEHGTVRLSVSGDETRVSFTVTDTGAGIPPVHHDRIFERFYRVDAGRSRTDGGTGLGLALVRNIAQRYGGTIEFTSAPGVGSTFVLTLPRARNQR